MRITKKAAHEALKDLEETWDVAFKGKKAKKLLYRMGEKEGKGI